MKATANTLPRRGRFEGMVNILRFNWPFYVQALAVALLVMTVVLIFPLPIFIQVMCVLGAIGSIFYLITSLLVSHWIYDCSSLYKLSWLDRLDSINPSRIINLTAGFDETTLGLKAKYPSATVEVLDFYDPEAHTEPSIARARAFRPPLTGTRQISPQRLGLELQGIDVALGILAFHEIREKQERAELFKSISKVLCLGGKCVMVEHLRDLPNFLAFGPGFFHFHSRKSWLLAMEGHALRLVDEFRLTPFVRVFILEKNHV